MDIGPVRRRLVAEPVVAPVPGVGEQQEPTEQPRADEHPAGDALATASPLVRDFP